MTSAAGLLESAAKLHQAGRLDEAEPIYRDLLRHDPNHPDALYLLGTVQYQRGSYGSAALFLRKAIDAFPHHVEARNNLGLVLESQGKLDEAATEFERVLAFNPRHADAHYNLGNVRRAQGRPDEALDAYDRAIRLRPDWPEALDNRGVALRDLGRWQEALESCRRAADLNPKNAGTLNNLGAILKGMGEYELAVDVFEEAVALDPQSAIARSNLGITHAYRRDFNLAEEHCRQALDMNRNSATLNHNLGLVYFLTGREQQAAQHFLEACRREPNFPDAHNNLASALCRLDQIDDAITHYRISAQQRPHWLTLKNLAGVLEQACDWSGAKSAYLEAAERSQDDPLLILRSAVVCPTVPDTAEEIAAYRRDLTRTLERVDERFSPRPAAELIDRDIRPSFAWQFHGMDDRPIREAFGRLVARYFPDETPPPRSGKPSVGFVVSAGHEYGFIRSIGGLFAHFRQDWHPVIVCSERGEARIRSSIPPHRWSLLPLPDRWQDATDAVAHAQLDMLYHWEVATGAFNYLLPFSRLTPLQVTSWGIQVTTGIPAMDAYISSELIETNRADPFYTERLVRLKTLLSYQRPMEMPTHPVPRETLGVHPSAHLYLCAQQLGKFHPDFDPILREILERDPDGELVVTRSRYLAENDAIRRRWQRTMGPTFDRIRMIPKQTGANYASLLAHASVILDPIHFGGVNTTYDAISAGKLSVTLPTAWNKGRFTSACYRTTGVTAGIVNTREEYVLTAVRLAREEEERRQWEADVLGRRDALFERKDVAWELEDWLIASIEEDRACRR